MLLHAWSLLRSPARLLLPVPSGLRGRCRRALETMRLLPAVRAAAACRRRGAGLPANSTRCVFCISDETHRVFASAVAAPKERSFVSSLFGEDPADESDWLLISLVNNYRSTRSAFQSVLSWLPL